MKETDLRESVEIGGQTDASSGAHGGASRDPT